MSSGQRYRQSTGTRSGRTSNSAHGILTMPIVTPMVDGSLSSSTWSRSQPVSTRAVKLAPRGQKKCGKLVASENEDLGMWGRRHSPETTSFLGYTARGTRSNGECLASYMKTVQASRFTPHALFCIMSFYVSATFRQSRTHAGAGAESTAHDEEPRETEALFREFNIFGQQPVDIKAPFRCGLASAEPWRAVS